MSEKFEIGAGRYVHDLEFFSWKEGSNPSRPTSPIITEKNKSISKKLDKGFGKYVDNVEFSQLQDLSPTFNDKSSEKCSSSQSLKDKRNNTASSSSKSFDKISRPIKWT